MHRRSFRAPEVRRRQHAAIARVFVIAPNNPQFALDAGVRKFRFALGVCAETALSQRLARVLARAPEARGVAAPGSRSRGSGQSRAFYERQKSRAMLRP
jgi:hypothetical protein